MSAGLYIVEDEPELAALVADYARAAGYLPTVFGDGAEALAAIRTRMPALVVLDLMLPGLDGLAVCRTVREFSEVPIVMVTARVEEIDRLLGLEAGADDYLCKPFSPRELMARIKAILRRAGTPVSQARAVAVDDAARRIAIHGKALELTPTEFALLAAMARRPGQVFSRAQLLDAARSDSFDVTDRAVDSHIKNLRRKIEAVAPGIEAIHSIYGLGYRFDL
jgi:two-component system response regulator BaeR